MSRFLLQLGLWVCRKEGRWGLHSGPVAVSLCEDEWECGCVVHRCPVSPERISQTESGDLELQSRLLRLDLLGDIWEKDAGVALTHQVNLLGPHLRERVEEGVKPFHNGSSVAVIIRVVGGTSAEASPNGLVYVHDICSAGP